MFKLNSLDEYTEIVHSGKLGGCEQKSYVGLHTGYVCLFMFRVLFSI